MINESCKIYERYANTPGDTAQKLYYYPQWAGHFVCNEDFYIKRSNFNSILILRTLSGKGKLIYRNEEHILSKDNAALINCSDEHTYYPLAGEEWSFEFLHFFGRNAIEFYEHIIDSCKGYIFHISSKIDAYINDCISLCRKKPPSYELLSSKIIGDIMHEFLIDSKSEEKDRIALVCKYISENYSQKLTTEKLAEISCFSRCYFSTVFKKVTGTTLHDYLICYRLDKAKELLTGGNLPISQIAELTGFGDLGTFIRAFKKKEKLTPLQYKKDYKK